MAYRGPVQGLAKDPVQLECSGVSGSEGALKHFTCPELIFLQKNLLILCAEERM